MKDPHRPEIQSRSTLAGPSRPISYTPQDVTLREFHALCVRLHAVRFRFLSAKGRLPSRMQKNVFAASQSKYLDQDTLEHSDPDTLNELLAALGNDV